MPSTSGLHQMIETVAAKTFSPSIRSIVIGAMMAASLTGTAVLSASSLRAENLEPTRSLLGSYLAARYAQSLRDSEAASTFFRLALERDADSEIILRQAFLTEAESGNWERASAFADQVARIENNNRLARMFLGLRAFKAGDFVAADQHFKEASAGPIGELTSGLARAWVKVAEGKAGEARSDLDTQLQADWARFYRSFHSALIADVAGDRESAGKIYAELVKLEPRNLSVLLAYAGHASNTGQPERAEALLLQYLAGNSAGHPNAVAALSQLRRGQPLPLLVSSATEGLAEVFYGLGEALTGEGGLDIGTVYLQFSLFLKPDNPLALAGLANVHENTRQYERAIDAYLRLPEGAPIAFNAAIRRALNLSALERDEDAKQLLLQLLEQKPSEADEPVEDATLLKSIAELPVLAPGSRGEAVKTLQGYLRLLGFETGTPDGVYGPATAAAVQKLQEASGLPARGTFGPQTRKALEQRLVGVGRSPGVKAGSQRQLQIYTALGNIERGRKNFEVAIDYYSRAIALLEQPSREHWSQFYSRGVCYERTKQWPKAEADFRKAIELDPEQPLVLNYLGYTWVDRGENLDEALAMINKAVKLKPDDGYFIDSLGWAYYRLGRFEEAAKTLERAVELKADDPVINDHLGDAYWQTGRTLEARFQWSQALQLKPEPEEIPKIEAKLKDGLPLLGAGRNTQRQADSGRSETGQPVQ
jgi:tetratricopeptide (TPR) repeat protein